MPFCCTTHLVSSLALELDQLPIKCFDIHPTPEKKISGCFGLSVLSDLMPAKGPMARKSRLLWFPILHLRVSAKKHDFQEMAVQGIAHLCKVI